MTRTVRILLVVPLLLVDAAYGDDAIPRYVAQQGEDRGDCTLPVRPCRTIQYALSVAGKGDQVRVAGGAYRFDEVQDLLPLVAGAVDVRGGFNRFDHFLQQSAAANRTVLEGIPVALRDRLQDRGFQVIVDRKGLDAAARRAIANYEVTQTSSGATACADDFAGAYPCKDVDLHAHMATSDLSTAPYSVADVWGFVDLNTEREYALLGLSNGLAAIDVTDPATPFEVGTVPGAFSHWRDVKVSQRYDSATHRWQTHAYVSTEYRGQLVVVDLTQLPNRVRLGRRWDVSAHNVYVSNVDYTTGVSLDTGDSPPLLQVLGSADNRGGFRSFDLDDPVSPRQIATSVGGYSHDATSMLVDDDRASSCKANASTCEVLLDFNEDTIEIWDFSDQAAPELLSSTTYDNASYVHSGWWTEDGRYLFVHDELDEYGANLDTTVRVFDLEDLANPVLAKIWTGPSRAVDHNGYVRGNRYFMSNYTRGLAVLDITDPLDPSEIGLFDTHPVSDRTYFGGAWGVYPFLPSGNVLVSDILGGLFVLGDRTRSSDHGRIGFSSTTYGGEEGDELAVTVVRSAGAEGAVSVDYTVLRGSADASDIELKSGTLDWPDNADGHVDNVRVISVPLNRDGLAEPIERAFVRLDNPTGGAVLADASMASVFVGDTGGTPTVAFDETSITVDESAQRVIATVRRSGSPVGAVSATYEIHSGSAREGSDYDAPATGELTWEDGDGTARTIFVPLVADDVEELAEQFELRLSSSRGAYIGVDKSLAVEINAENMAVTGFMLFDDGFGQDVQEISDGGTYLTDEMPDYPRVRVEVRNAGSEGSVGVTVEGSDEIHVDNDPPYVFDVLGVLPIGEYSLQAAPYSRPGAGGVAGQPLEVTLTVADEPPGPSDDATLSGLELSGVDLNFDSGITNYEVSVPKSVRLITVSATPATGATCRIAPYDADSATSGHQVKLVMGMNDIVFDVTAEDEVATNTYSVRVVRGGPIDDGVER